MTVGTTYIGGGACVKEARVLVVPQAAHLANAERPERITSALIEHLAQS